MAACAKSLAETNEHVESMTLLEAAFSHYGFSPNNGKGQAGFFRADRSSGCYRPACRTFSAQDTVVGKVYAIASRLAGAIMCKRLGTPNDPYGGIGRNGAQKTAEASSGTLHAVGASYQFHCSKIECLDGSGGLIRDHSDVTNSTVTYAFASVVAET